MHHPARHPSTMLAAAALVLAACGGDGTGPEQPALALDDASLAAVTALPLDAGAMATPSGGAFAAPRCTFRDASGRFECEPVSSEGVTITRSYAFADAGGRSQPRYDPMTTARIDVRSHLAGTVTIPGAGVDIIMDSERQTTVSGLLGEETTQTVNGTRSGTNQSRVNGSLGAVVTGNDTTLNVVVPVQGPPVTGQARARVIPLSGQDRSSSKWMTTRNGLPFQAESRQVTTYNGTRMASVELWTNGELRTCQLDLLNPAASCIWLLPG